MKKTIISILGAAIAASPAVLADWGMMGDYGMMGGFGMGIFGIVYFAIAAFVFSIIFWLTHNWLVPKKKR